MENLFKQAGDTFQTAIIPAAQDAFSRHSDYVKTAVVPAAEQVISRGNDYMKTMALPAAQDAICRAGDYVKTAVLPAANQAGAFISTRALQVWEVQSFGGTSLKDLVGPTIDSLANSPAVIFIANKPWILLPVLIPHLVPALEVWLALIGFAANGIVADSIAAAIEASIGNIPKGSLFAFLQSYGARGFAHQVVTLHAQRAQQLVVLGVLLATAGKFLIESGLLEEKVSPVLQKCWGGMVTRGQALKAKL